MNVSKFGEILDLCEELDEIEQILGKDPTSWVEWFHSKEDPKSTTAAAVVFRDDHADDEHQGGDDADPDVR